MIIETHGMQHYKDIKKFKRTLKEEQENDRFKKELALKNGIKTYIVLDCRESNCKWIKNSILSSELSEYMNLKIVDWEKIDSTSLGSVFIETCKLYKKGILKEDIMKKLHISYITYHRYIVLGTEYGLCSYNSKQSLKENGIKSSGCSKKPVICVTTEKIFDSIKNATNYYGINPTALSAYFRRNGKYCGKDKGTNKRLTWKLI